MLLCSVRLGLGGATLGCWAAGQRTLGSCYDKDLVWGDAGSVACMPREEFGGSNPFGLETRIPESCVEIAPILAQVAGVTESLESFFWTHVRWCFLRSC